MSSETKSVSRAEFEALKAELAELKLSGAQRTLRAMRRNKRAILAGAIIGLVIPVAISSLSITKSHTFAAGNPTVASEVNTNFDQLFTKVNDLAAYHPPIGTILAWHKSFGGVTPGLPISGEWVECNGQTLGSIGSVYDGLVVPNLNGAGGGANSPGQSTQVQMFLRGGTTSGTGQEDAFQGHWHNLLWYSTEVGSIETQNAGPMGNGKIQYGSGTSISQDLEVRSARNDGASGIPRTATETRPINMSVVWIMKVK